MAKPLRRWLLNRQIELEARRIAHHATKTCKMEYREDTDYADEHSPKCNLLKREIANLAMQVKFSALQPPQKGERTDDDAPAIMNEMESDNA